jgi:hypothetical protein
VKDTSKLNDLDSVLKFIHKKNPNKGKVSSIKMKGPYKSDNVDKWIVFYEAPQNKNHVDTEWTLCCPDGNFTVYNGALVIHTQNNDTSNTFPDLSKVENIGDNVADDWRERENLNVEDEDEDEEDEDEEEDDDDDDDDTNVRPRVKFNNDDDDDDDDDDDEEEDDDDEELENNNKNVKVSVELEDDLVTLRNTNLQYEVYDYDAEIIPCGNV